MFDELGEPCDVLRLDGGDFLLLEVSHLLEQLLVEEVLFGVLPEVLVHVCVLLSRGLLLLLLWRQRLELDFLVDSEDVADGLHDDAHGLRRVGVALEEREIFLGDFLQGLDGLLEQGQHARELLFALFV